MQKKANVRLSLSYIFSYLLIFIIPFSIMSLIFYHNSVKSLRTEIELSNINNLNNIKRLVDGRIKELNNIGALISIDQNLRPYRLAKYENLPEAIDEIMKYKQNSSIIEDIYLYYFHQPFIFTSNGHMSANTFLEYRAHVDTSEVDVSTFTDYLTTVEYPGIFTDFSLFGDSSYFVYPLPPGSFSNQGVVIMELEDHFFENMINNILGGYEGNVFILNEKNQLISAFSNNPLSLMNEEREEIFTTQKSIFEMTINDEHYSIVKVTSELSHWSFIMMMPTQQFFSKVSEFKTFMSLITVFIFVGAIGMAVYSALKTYEPIRRLVEIVLMKNSSLQFNTKSDLVNLSAVVENLYLEHVDLSNKYTKQEPLIRDQCLISLLNGSTNTYYQSSDLYESLQLDFSGPNSFVIVTAFSQEQLTDLDMQEIELAAKQFLSQGNIYGVELIQDKVTAYIVNGNIATKEEKAKFLSEFYNLLKNEHILCIGVGKTYQGVERIKRSFIEASAAFEYGKTHQIFDIVHFEEINDEQETIWLPKTYLLKLTQSCKQGNIEIAEEAVNSLIQWIQKNKIPGHLVQYMKYDIVNTVIKIASETGISLQIQKMYDSMDHSDIQTFQKNLMEIVEEICKKISKKKEDQKNKLQHDILEYIHNHFHDYNLSLESIAQKFNLSTSYLSRFIKEETSKTFSQYVWELRLETVKKQLVETDLPIKDIVTSVGYIDAPNFTRKFKQTVGMTPSEYRMIHSKK